MKIVVGRVSDFAPGDKRIVEAGKRSIGVYRIGDRFYALANSCPHQGGPLCEGRTKSWAYSDTPGEAALDEDTTFVACPWHGWEYEISTGQSFLGPGEPPARGYGVNVTTGGELDGATPGRPPQRPRGARDSTVGCAGDGAARQSSVGAGRTPGPYVAETFDVEVDEDYVVIDTSPRARPKPPNPDRTANTDHTAGPNRTAGPDRTPSTASRPTTAGVSAE